jgi:5-oxoprolinase (ATP-hydrolysing)
MENCQTRFRFNIDRGGTFTDIYCEYYNTTKINNHSHVVYKLLSQDKANYEDAPSEGIRRIISKVLAKEIKKGDKIPSYIIDSVRMGTTIATNALLEHKGEKCALLITEGFKDLLEIGNQSRQNIFDLKIPKPEKIYDYVYEVKERVRILSEEEKLQFLSNPESSKYNRIFKGATGEFVEIIKELNEEEILENLSEINQNGIKSVAIALVHSYTFREHENKIKNIIIRHQKDFPNIVNISVSSEIMPLVKFFPRACTAVVDAYLTPAIHNYVRKFLSFFTGELEVLFMQSDGGLTSHNNFCGSKAIISGPAGGVVGFSKTTSLEMGNKKPIIGYDMGGTSTDVSRYDKEWDHVFQIEIAGIIINSPQIDVNTVAAGGGSRLFYKNGLFIAGPESAGSDPGPICYRKNGHLAVTDANLMLGRLIPKYFPKIFGKNFDEELDYQSVHKEFKKLAKVVEDSDNFTMNEFEVAMGFIKVANESMSKPIKALTQARGYDPKDHILSVFGAAGGQHACAIAKLLNMKKIYIHKFAGILSAYGIAIADIVEEKQDAINLIYNEENIQHIYEEKFESLISSSKEKLKKLENDDLEYIVQKYLLLRYEGNDYSIAVPEPEDRNYPKKFEECYKREYGFLLEKREILIDYVRVRVILQKKRIIDSSDDIKYIEKENYKSNITHLDETFTYFDVKEKVVKLLTKVYDWENLEPFTKIEGPALLLSGNQTVLIEPSCIAYTTKLCNLLIELSEDSINLVKAEDIVIEKTPIELSLFANRFMSIAEQMGRHLQRTAVSTNIKERLDFSCAIFSPDGNLVANAPHLPVHLGAMQEAVKAQINHLKEDWKEGEVVLSNHPMARGSHLPDLTVMTPVFIKGKIAFFLANRGHHADIGGLTPGSMPPFSKTIHDEGAAIFSHKIVKNNIFQEKDTIYLLTDDLIKKNVPKSRRLYDNISDLKAQVASNNKGIYLIFDLINKYGLEKVQAFMNFIQESAETAVKNMLDEFGKRINIEEEKKGTVYSEDYMDDGSKICLKMTINRKEKTAIFDFTGSGAQVYGNTNSPKAVVYSAIIYCLRCLVNTEIPLNQGCLKPIEVIIPKNSLLWPSSEAAVVGGNVLTSQRITDIILKGFSACANSQGCMNNFTFGNDEISYYETIGGGAGAGPTWHGRRGVQVHMTNTRITDVEIMERRYPVMIETFSYRQNSGGKGFYSGGDGLIRKFLFLKDLGVSILSERRVYSPNGIEGGENGEKGYNYYINKEGYVFNLGGKNSISVKKGESILIMTPGGGGYGKYDNSKRREEDESINFKQNTNFNVGSLAKYYNDQYSV